MRNNRTSKDSSFNVKKDNHYTYYKNRFYSNDQNFYINLFSIALLMDLDNHDNKDIYILYNHNNKYYFAILDNSDKEIKQDFDSIVTNFFNVDSSLLKIIGNNDDKEHNNILYDPMRMIVRISYETFLMIDKILRLDFDHDYDNIIEAINVMQLRAQEKVLNKIREFIHETQDISNLLKRIITPIEKFMDDSFFYKYERIINKERYVDYIVNYNTQYQYLYIDNLLYMALYYRYMTLFQLNPFNPNITYEKYEKLAYKCMISSLGSIPFQHNNIFNNIMDIPTAKRKLFEENFDENKAMIYNGLRIYSEKLYAFSNHNNYKWIANNICIESQLSNSIQNLYSSIFNINNYIINVTTEARLSLYTPSFDNLSKKKFKNKLSKALYNLNYIDYIGRNTNSNRPKSNDINKASTYGELLLGAAIDTTGNFFNHNPGYHGKHVNYNMGFSPFQGYMQSNTHVILNNMHNQYHSSIWLRPLYQDQLYNIGIMQNHLAPYNLIKTKNKIIYNNYDNYNNNNTIYKPVEELYYTSSQYHSKNSYLNMLYAKTFINTSQSLPYYYINNSNDYNYTYYQLSLVSTILIRLYMIGILTTIAKVKGYDSLVIGDEDYINEYFEILDGVDSLESLYNNFKKCCIIKIKDINNDYNINYLQRMFIFKIGDVYYTRDPFTLKNNYYNKQFFYETFELYVNDAMRVNKETLLRIKDIATEDIISCPMF